MSLPLKGRGAEMGLLCVSKELDFQEVRYSDVWGLWTLS